MAAIGARSSTGRFCISRSAITRRSTLRLRADCDESRPARRASTSWRAAIGRPSPIRRTNSPTPDWPGRSPTTSDTSAQQSIARSPITRDTRLSAAAKATRMATNAWENPLTPTYDPTNIFAKILRGEAPCVKVYEDDVALAFMDVMPRADGHTLVIPKVPARTLFDLAPQDLARFMPAVQKVGRAVMAGMKAEGLLLQQFNEPASGQQVFHLHFHLLPCWTGVAIRPPGGPFQSAETLKPHAEKIIAALAHV